VAFIGTRRPSPKQLTELYRAVKELPRGLIFHTGAALGVDQAAARAALERYSLHVVLHIPWAGYQHGFVQALRAFAPKRVSVEFPPTPEDEAIAVAHHPRPDLLTPDARLLHARNVRIVQPCTFGVFAYPGRAPWGGGTAMGIRLARHFGHPCTIQDPLNREWATCGCKL